MQHHPRLSEAKDQYLLMRRARFATQSVINGGYVLNRFVAWLGEDIQDRNLTAQRVESYFYGPEGPCGEHVTTDGKTRQCVQEATHNHYRSRSKMLFACCTHNNWLRQDLRAAVAAPASDSHAATLALYRPAANAWPFSVGAPVGPMPAAAKRHRRR